MSAQLGGLFPTGAVVAELREPGDPEFLLPVEAMQVARAVPKRVREFAAGRACARRALAEFGIAGFAIGMAPDRQPIWPPHMTGSITHTADFAAAVVAERARIPGIGIDSEIVGHVNAQIWPSICIPSETAWIRSLPASEQSAAVTLIFSAKEAFYKCQYPLVAERLNFHDVRVEAARWGTSAGAFRIHPLRRLSLAAQFPLPMQGRYRFDAEFVTAGIALSAGVTRG